MKSKITAEDYKLVKFGRGCILEYMDDADLGLEGIIMAGRALNVFYRWPNTNHSDASISIVFDDNKYDSNDDEYGVEVNFEIWGGRLSVSIESDSNFVAENFDCGTGSRTIEKKGLDEGYINPAELEGLVNYMFNSGGYVRINDDETNNWADIVSNLWNFDGLPIEDAFDNLSFIEGDFLGFVFSSGYTELASVLKDSSKERQAKLYELYRSAPSDLRERRYEQIFRDDESIMVGQQQIASAELFCSLVDDYIRKECENRLLLQSNWLAEFLNHELVWHRAKKWIYTVTDDE